MVNNRGKPQNEQKGSNKVGETGAGAWQGAEALTVGPEGEDDVNVKAAKIKRVAVVRHEERAEEKAAKEKKNSFKVALFYAGAKKVWGR